jgi:hypothetical protein
MDLIATSLICALMGVDYSLKCQRKHKHDTTLFKISPPFVPRLTLVLQAPVLRYSSTLRPAGSMTHDRITHPEKN